MEHVTSLQRKAAEIRREVLGMICHAGTGHTGGTLSSVDILTVLYYHVLKVDPKNPKDPDRDRFILSKGHSVEGYYTILADRGFFDTEELSTFSSYKSRLIGHPSVKVPGVELNTGALGHGLSCSVGMAIAAKKAVSPSRIYCLMGDGEQAEGSVWEAAMAGAHYRLDNLTAVIDRNYLQISGNTEDVMGLDNLGAKWEAFGWQVVPADGHDMGSLINAFSVPHDAGKPKIIIARTIKGKGVDFMEGIAAWHHGVPSKEQYKKAVTVLDELIRGMT
ncbi:MAG: transketolase [Spirochaetia bacterium]|nr:transketolase [Spirochaetia bacterium]